MAPSRSTVLVLFGLVASIRAIPAALPEPEAQTDLTPPSHSVSWDQPLPVATEEPEEPEYPAPQPSDQISLGPPSATISWDGSPAPTEEPHSDDPEDPEDPGDPETPQPSPSNVISLNPPSFSVSWDGPRPPKTTRKPTKKPCPPRPTRKSSTKGYVSYTVSWGKAQEDPQSRPTNVISLNPPTYSVSWDGPRPPKTTRKPWPPSPSHKTSTKGYPSWSKRQEDEDPEPTDFPGSEDPEDPEDPEGPIVFPSFPVPTPSDSIGIQPPQVSFSWGKRQEDEPEPTDFPMPEDPEDPEYPDEPEDPDSPVDLPVGPMPTPSNSIGIQPPEVSFSWGKREEAVPTFGLKKPSTTKKSPKPPKSTENWVSWGKRQEDDGPTEVFPQDPTPSDQITLVPPTATISWGRRDGEMQRPTTMKTHKSRPSITGHVSTPLVSSCATVTKTVVSPCVPPPVCPHGLVGCKVGAVQVREIEKTVVTITTVAKPSRRPTATKSVCMPVTKTLHLGCPTYTCVPSSDCALKA